MQNLLITGKADTAAPEWRENCIKRWGFDPLEPVPIDPKAGPLVDNQDDDNEELRYVTGEEMLYMVADNTCKGSPEDASRKILQDFRAGRMGPVCLQLAPELLQQEHDNNNNQALIHDFTQVPDPRMGTMRTGYAVSSMNNWEQYRQQQETERLKRVKMARETAKERGLELPPQLENASQDSSKDEKNQSAPPEDVGKGLFDGW